MNQLQSKPFCISKHDVLEAWRRVKANQGAAGVDEESISDFERKLKDNLYRLWNRMSSGSYLPPPVRTVSIPKTGGGERKLGIPTVMDRVAQLVVKMHLEPEVEPLFHEDSYPTTIRAGILRLFTSSHIDNRAAETIEFPFRIKFHAAPCVDPPTGIFAQAKSIFCIVRFSCGQSARSPS